MAETCLAPDDEPVYTLGLTPRMTLVLTIFFSCIPLLTLLLGPKLIFWVGGLLGKHLKKKTNRRKCQILETVNKDQAAWEKKSRESDDWENLDSTTLVTAKNEGTGEEDWDGIVGFFHPFCNAGGGGERVLWAAIRATQKRWPQAKVVVYTGDHDVDKTAMLDRVRNRFNIVLHPPTITFLYLTTRSWVLASTWPRFTLLGQSIGSLVMAWDAFSLLPPDIFVDTMGYAFSSGFSKILFSHVPTGSYVHYPTISTDMLSSLDSNSPNSVHGIHAGRGAGLSGELKKLYWNLFAKAYSAVGGSIDFVTTNSSWTSEHITSLWGSWRREFHKPAPTVLYPPVAVEELETAIEVSASSESQRENVLLYIAQFRPEKNHTLILNSFAAFKKSPSPSASTARLVLIGSVRDDSDAKRVYELRLLANELKVKEDVEFHLDASWPEILAWLGRASVGVNGMWNEHFGIGVVEYQAAGLISVVHDSGGPKRDIVVARAGEQTGFHACTEAEFAAAFASALELPRAEKVRVRQRARRSAGRFTEEVFARGWVRMMEQLVAMTDRRSGAKDKRI